MFRTLEIRTADSVILLPLSDLPQMRPKKEYSGFK